MSPGLLEFNLASHLVWWVAGAVTLVLGVFALLEAWDGVRDWMARRRASRDPTMSSFQVTEGRKLRKHHYRRFEPGFQSLQSRGLGDPPLRTTDEWSPTRHGGDREVPRASDDQETDSA